MCHLAGSGRTTIMIIIFLIITAFLQQLYILLGLGAYHVTRKRYDLTRFNN
jgi:hypothetical protein